MCKIQQACSAFSKDDGLNKFIAKLRELYGAYNEQTTFSAHEKFVTFQQSEGMNINDYISENEQSNQNLVTYKIRVTISSLCLLVIKNANLPKEKKEILLELQYMILLKNQ